MNEEIPMDAYLKRYVEKYAGWKKEGGFTYSSRVIPVQESFAPQQWVIPQEQVIRILQDARSFALTDCMCRSHYGRCDRPKEVCFLINELADKTVSRGKARYVSLEEASERLRLADRHGLVHMALYMPGHRVYALCSCCPCCCHDLRLLLEYRRTDLVARSDYTAETDAGRCTSCGLCADRCIFGARTMDAGMFAFDPASCLGCGLCVSACPEQAIAMRERPG